MRKTVEVRQSRHLRRAGGGSEGSEDMCSGRLKTASKTTNMHIYSKGGKSVRIRGFYRGKKNVEEFREGLKSTGKKYHIC